MSRIVPSQVVSLIDQYYPGARVNAPDPNYPLGYAELTQLSAIASLARQIPSELIVLEEHQYAEFISRLTILETALRTWERHGNNNVVIRLPILASIRNCIASCPDRYPSPQVAGLDFIKDEELKHSLREDIDEVNQALSDSDWKAATVLGGSIVEALLLHAIQQKSQSEIQQTTNQLGIKNQNPEEWFLPELIKVSRRLRIIKDTSVAQAELAKEFRNLIHPGRSIRLKQKCDRGTALSAVAAIEHVVRDLS